MISSRVAAVLGSAMGLSELKSESRLGFCFTLPISINFAVSMDRHHLLDSTLAIRIFSDFNQAPMAFACALPSSERFRWVEQSPILKFAGSPTPGAIA